MLSARIANKLRMREPSWRRAPMWVPAPRPVVDPIAAGVDAARLVMPETFARLASPPVFICGSARSGTTWTFDLFDRHPRVSAVCESWILSQTHGVTSVLTQPYWDTSIKRGWAEHVDVPFGAVQLLSYEELIRDVRDLIASWLGKGLRAEHLYLAAKEPIDVHAAAILFPAARFIHVIRDGRNVALSMRRASETWDPSMGVGLRMEMRAEAWRRQVEAIRSHRALLGERYMEIRYETLRHDVMAGARAMFEFAEIDHDDDLLQQIASSTQLPSYGEAAHGSGFRGGGANRGWSREFTVRDAWGFHRAAGDLLTDLGYENDPWWWLSRLAPWRGNGSRRAEPLTVV